MPTSPTPIAAGPAIPDRATAAEGVFDDGMEAFDTWLVVNAVPGMSSLAETTYNNTVEAVGAAATATAQAQAAVAAVNAVKWVAGTYSEPTCVWSPTNGRTYRARGTFTSSVDPVSDPTNWWDIASFSQSSTAYLTTATELSRGVNSILLTDAISYPLPPNPTQGDWVGYRNASGGTTLTLDPGTKKVEETTGPYTLDIPGFMGVLSYTGSTKGWVHVPR